MIESGPAPLNSDLRVPPCFRSLKSWVPTIHLLLIFLFCQKKTLLFRVYRGELKYNLPSELTVTPLFSFEKKRSLSRPRLTDNFSNYFLSFCLWSVVPIFLIDPTLSYLDYYYSLKRRRSFKLRLLSVLYLS